MFRYIFLFLFVCSSAFAAGNQFPPSGDSTTIMLGNRIRSLTSKLNDFSISVMDFGAKRYGVDANYSDGSNDSAFQAGLTALQTAGGGLLQLPCGTFGTSSANFTYSGGNLVVRGSGLCTKIVKNSPTSNLFTISGDNVEFEDFIVTTSGADSGGTLFNFVSGGNNVILNNVLINGGYDVLHLPTGAAQTFLNNVLMNNFTRNGVWLQQGYGGQFYATNVSMNVYGENTPGATSGNINHGIGLFIQGGDTFVLNGVGITATATPVVVQPPGGLSLTASIASNVLTVTAVSGGMLSYGIDIKGSGVPTTTTIRSQLSGTPGGVGTYTISTSATVSSEAMTGNGFVRAMFISNSAADGVGRATSGPGWYFNGNAGNGEISRVVATTTSGSTMANDGWRVQGVNNFSCTNCFADTNVGNGLNFSGNPSSTDVTISDSYVFGNSVGNCGTSDGIALGDYVQQVSIHDVHSGASLGPGGYVSATCQRYGLNFLGTHYDHISVHDNHFDGNLTANINNQPTATTTIIYHDNM